MRINLKRKDSKKKSVINNISGYLFLEEVIVVGAILVVTLVMILSFLGIKEDKAPKLLQNDTQIEQVLM